MTALRCLILCLVTTGTADEWSAVSSNVYPTTDSSQCRPGLIEAGDAGRTWRVCDPASILSRSSNDQIEKRLDAFAKEGPAFGCGRDGEMKPFQLGVALIDKITGEDVQTFSERVFNRWGIGHRECNNGVIFVLSRLDRKSYIKVRSLAFEGMLLPIQLKGNVISTTQTVWSD